MSLTSSPIARWAWTAFVLLGVFLILIGLMDALTPGATNDGKEAARNFVVMGLLALVGAVGGLRRGERWAWFLMAVWPVWAVVETIRTLIEDKPGIAATTGFFLILTVAALALSYPRTFQPKPA